MGTCQERDNSGKNPVMRTIAAIALVRLLYAPSASHVTGMGLECLYLTAKETRMRGWHTSMCITQAGGTGGGVLLDRKGKVRCTFKLRLEGSCITVEGCTDYQRICQ